MSTPIPLWILRDLVCRHCKNFLSCGPVYVTPDCGLLCGRCKTLAKPNFRNYVYEELAGTFRFPCMNWEKRCPYEGPWNTMKEHEIDCPYSGSCRLICIDPSAVFSSKRRLPNEESLLYMEVPEKCLNLVSCKNCGKYLSCEPVHINIVGSNICHRCYLSNGIPPNTLRNLAYEKLADIFRFPCIFRAKGCPMKFKFGRDSWEHEVACHYKDIQISPSILQIEPNYLHPLNGIDNSGYRHSYDKSAPIKYLEERLRGPTLELPRVSSILRNHERRLMNATKNEEFNEIIIDHQPTLGIFRDDPPNPEKEKGVIPTHTGHVYATLTQNSILFAPPQIQPNKDPSDGIKVTREFQDKIRRNTSNVSQKEYISENKKKTSVDNIRNEKYQHHLSSVDFPALNENQMKDFEWFNEEYAPVVKEYVQYNPKNKVHRNESLTIGNPDLIAELKIRNEQQRMRKQQEQEKQQQEMNVDGIKAF